MTPITDDIKAKQQETSAASALKKRIWHAPKLARPEARTPSSQAIAHRVEMRAKARVLA